MAGGGTVRFLRARRGMSPLIATVLLMAFAVALGGMIMNWSIDAGANSDCDEIEVSVSRFCVQENNILLTLANSADGLPLRGIKLNVVADNVESTLSVKSSELEPGQSVDLRIPYAGGPGSRVDVVGVIGAGADPFTCDDRPIERVDPIATC